MAVSKNWPTNHTSTSRGENLTLSVLSPHLRLFFFSSLKWYRRTAIPNMLDQCQILKGLVEMTGTVISVKTPCTPLFDVSLWVRCRVLKEVCSIQLSRPTLWEITDYICWFTLSSSFLFMCSACKPNLGIYLINYLSAFAGWGFSQIC